MRNTQPDGAGAAPARSGAADWQPPQPAAVAPPASDAAAASSVAQSSPGGTCVSSAVQPNGTIQVPEAAQGRNEIASRKRKLPPSLATAAPPLTIRSLAAPRKPALPAPQAASRNGTSGDGQRQSLTGVAGAASRPAPWQPASAQPGPSPGAGPPARAPPGVALPAGKAPGPRRLPSSLLQPPMTGVAATHPSLLLRLCCKYSTL